MAVDLVAAKATVGTNGTLTVVTKTFMTAAQVAAVAAAVSSSTSTITTGTDWVQVSTAVVPTTPVTQAAAETSSRVADLNNPNTAGVLGS